MNIGVIIQNYNNKKYKVFYSTENYEILCVKDYITGKEIPNVLNDFDKQIKKQLRKEEENHIKTVFKTTTKAFTAQCVAIKYKTAKEITFKDVLIIDYNNIPIMLDGNNLDLYAKLHNNNKCYDLAEDIEYIVLISEKEEKTLTNIKHKIKTAKEQLASGIKDLNEFKEKITTEYKNNIDDDDTEIDIEY